MQGEHNGWRWFESAQGHLGQVLAAVPELLVGRFVAVTAFDSGPLELSETEMKSGWTRQGEVAISPRVEDATLVPRGGYDEWYVFSTQPPALDIEIFVNYGGFTLGCVTPSQSDPTWDRRLESQQVEAREAQQVRFWSQLQTIMPDVYLAEGDNLIVVARDVELIERLATSLSALWSNG